VSANGRPIDAIDVENRTPHCLNRALAIDFRITHFEVIFLKGDEAREEREGAGAVKAPRSSPLV